AALASTRAHCALRSASLAATSCSTRSPLRRFVPRTRARRGRAWTRRPWPFAPCWNDSGGYICRSKGARIRLVHQTAVAGAREAADLLAAVAAVVGVAAAPRTRGRALQHCP